MLVHILAETRISLILASQQCTEVLQSGNGVREHCLLLDNAKQA